MQSTNTETENEGKEDEQKEGDIHGNTERDDEEVSKSLLSTYVVQLSHLKLPWCISR